jgi:hypothetical protein
MTALRQNGKRHRKTISTALLVAALAALFSIPIGNFGGPGAAAAYYYYSGGGPAVLVLSPATATNTVGTSHTVTATVTQDTNPVSGVMVSFSVTGSVTIGGSCTTDSNGRCTFTYSGPAFPGADVITAYPDVNGNGTRDADELTATATKTWVLPASTCGETHGAGAIKTATGFGLFVFAARSDGAGHVAGRGAYYDTGTKQRLLFSQVTALVVVDSTAQLYGMGRVDGGPLQPFRIDVTDTATTETFGIAWAGYVASGPVLKGKVEVEPCGADADDHKPGKHHDDD